MTPDARVREGMARQMELRRRRLESGEQPIGWKAGFGAPAALERFGLRGPLVGFLTDASLAPPGGEVSIAGWRRPVAEPEIAVHLGSGLSGEEDREGVRAAVAAIGPAIELADVHPEPEDVEAILAGNIFHRRVVLGPAATERAGAVLDGLTARIRVDGEEAAATSELEALTGKLLDVVAHAARQLRESGERLSAGDVLIAGSVVPPLPITPGHEVVHELEPLGLVSVRIG